MDTEWTPDENTLQELMQLLDMSRNFNVKSTKEHADRITDNQAKLNEYSNDIVFINYMAYIFGMLDDGNFELRQLAGLALKYQIEVKFAYMHAHALEYCKKMIMNAYMSQAKVVRQTAWNVISLIILKGGINAWPDILEFLTGQISSTDDEIIETSVQAISFIVEDSESLLGEAKYAEEIDALFPNLCQLLICEPQKNENIISIVVNTINMLIVLNTQIIYDSTEQYLEVLIKLFDIESVSIKTRVIQGITMILDFRMELILKHHEITMQKVLEALNYKGKFL